MDSKRGEQQASDRFQFSLKHLFLLIFLTSLYFPAVTVFGEFGPPAILGVFIVVVAVTVAKIENMVVGAVLGAIVAACWYSATALFWGLSGVGLVAIGSIFYIAFGYVLGAVAAAGRDFQNA
jgi:hypothetical protein